MSRRPHREISVLVPPNLIPATSDDPRHVGPYQVIGRIGSGGTGTAYAAVNPTTQGDPLVAVKVLSSPLLEDPAARAVLNRRLTALGAVDGRIYVPPVAFDTASAPPWLAMEYVSGVPLAQFARRHGALGSGRLIALAAGLAEGLSALHVKSVAHGDLKPANVLLGGAGPRILDCALPGDDEHLRRSAAAWLSPERHTGEPPTPAADVFAWGAVMAFASTGRLPFGMGEPHVLARRVSQADPDLVGAPEELLPLIRRALAKDPDDRPTVRELLGSAIAAWEANTSTTADAVKGTAVTRVLSREWKGVAEQSRLPKVIRLDNGTRPRTGGTGAAGAKGGAGRSRLPLLAAGGGVLALALVGGAAWGVLTALDGGSGGDEAAASPSPSADTVDDSTAVVRFVPAEQQNPIDGPWEFTPVEQAENAEAAADGGAAAGGTVTPDTWSAQWSEAGDPQQAVIAPDAEVLCAQFCVPGPGHIEEGRGTYPVRGQDFIDYLSWGNVVIAEVEFADTAGEGPREIVGVTELFPAPPQ
ncbi:serine/threonine-protein kinase [Nocardiopsis sediminis]|uniref:Serine/threonine-protein kinase n=1 Tax=Nocardiopsis sediminis TaxID=1778267 RepID=A0ABV8FM67_9ACTN